MSLVERYVGGRSGQCLPQQFQPEFLAPRCGQVRVIRDFQLFQNLSG
jgi:hypothetical protein